MNEPAFFLKLGQSGILRFDKGFLTILRKAASRTKRGDFLALTSLTVGQNSY